MFILCHKCKKQNDYYNSRTLSEAIIIKGKQLYGSFSYSKYFCPLSERKTRNKDVPENMEEILIVDCMNGDRKEIREREIKE